MDLLRVAIAISAGRPNDRVPEEAFIEHLRQELADQVLATERLPVRSSVTARARLVVGVAAAFSTLGGTVLATTSVEHALAAAPVPRHAYGQLLKMGTFESADGHAIGEITAYDGNPSWVFMSIRAPGVSGTVRCQIEMDDGHMDAAGTFVVKDGIGDWARPIPLDVNQIRGARLVTSQGSELATANFAES